MAKNYTYKESKVTTKKLVGMYDAEKHTIEVDGEDKDIIAELKDFEGAIIEVVIKEKSETDLSDEQRVGENICLFAKVNDWQII